MELKPVYLLAREPEPATRRMVSRRSLLGCAAIAFAVGTVSGRLLRSVVVSKVVPPDRATSEIGLAWAREIQAAELPVFLAARHMFFTVAVEFPARASELEPGLSRLIAHALNEQTQAHERSQLAAELLGCLEQLGGALSAPVRAELPRLRALRR